MRGMRRSIARMDSDADLGPGATACRNINAERPPWDRQQEPLLTRT